MPEHIHCDSPDILGDHITSPFDEGVGLRAERKIDGRARRSAVADQGRKFIELEGLRFTGGDSWGGDAGTSMDMVTIKGGKTTMVI